MMAAMVLGNLLYVAGAIVAATVVSGAVVLRHRRPKSLESSIEMFSRELKALQPERSGSGATIWKTVTNIQTDPTSTWRVAGAAVGDAAYAQSGSDGAGASSPEQESEPG